MRLFSKEHYELITQFDKEFKKEGRLDKEPKELWSRGRIYQHADINNMFLAYRKGIAYGKSLN